MLDHFLMSDNDFSLKAKVCVFQNSGVSAFWMDQEARDEKVNFPPTPNLPFSYL